MSYNDPNGIENATQNTFAPVNLDIVLVYIQVCFVNILWVAFSIPSGSLSPLYINI
jgi:hypothetical protein